jgi:hypothetical protein
MEIENLIGKYIYNNSLNIGGYPMVDILTVHGFIP